jgi:hypothetical protein
VQTSMHVQTSGSKACRITRNLFYVVGGQLNKGNCPVGKPWKKFKGFCKICDIQGHNDVNCHALKKNNHNGQERKVQGETRKCFSCNRTGHLAQYCLTKKANTEFVSCILSYNPPGAHNKVIIENSKSEDFELEKKIVWINVLDLVQKIEKKGNRLHISM